MAITHFVSAPDVLRMKIDLRDRFLDLTFASALAGQFRFINERNVPAVELGKMLNEGVGRATAYRVEHQMTDAIMARAHAIEDNEPIHMPPSQHGFVVLEKPIELMEMRGRKELIHVVQWTTANFKFESGEPTATGYVFTFWNDLDFEPDDIAVESLAGYTQHELDTLNHSGRWSCTNIRPVVCGSTTYSVGPQWVSVPPDKKQKCIDDGYPDALDATFNIIRIVSAIFESLSEPSPKSINRNDSAEVTRTERKLAKRESISPEVVLVTLNPTFREVEVNRGSGVPIGVKYHVGVEGEDVAYYRTIHKGTERERRVPVRPHWRGKPDAPESQRKVVRNLAY